jgi:peptidoglycan-N-acetylmuramic acid deacetylase
MPRAIDQRVGATRLVTRRRALGLALGPGLGLHLGAALGATPATTDCAKPVYLTFDTGHMEVAPLVSQVLAKHGVLCTFFLAAERTKRGGHALDDTWAPWWKQRSQEGHVFGSHTWNHDIWRADVPQGFRLVPTAGPDANRSHVLNAQAYCAELRRPAERFLQMTGQPMSALFRAAGGKTSKALLQTTQACGWAHVPWSDAGFLGDELPSQTHPNDVLLDRALKSIREGDILLAHLGIWSRQDPWAPAVLEPLIVGLKAQGFCFRTLRDHPLFAGAARHTAPTA